MSLLDYVFMNFYTASRMRGLSDRMAAMAAAKPARSGRVKDLETDLNSVALLCMALVGTLVEKGVISELDLEMHLGALDELDGTVDGGLDVNALRKAMGMQPANRTALPKKARLKAKEPARAKNPGTRRKKR